MSRPPPPPKTGKILAFESMSSTTSRKKADRETRTSHGERVAGNTLVQLLDHERWDRQRVTLERDYLRAENERLKIELVETKLLRDKWLDAYENMCKNITREHREYIGLLHTLRSELSGLRMDLFYDREDKHKIPAPLSISSSSSRALKPKIATPLSTRSTPDTAKPQRQGVKGFNRDFYGAGSPTLPATTFAGIASPPQV